MVRKISDLINGVRPHESKVEHIFNLYLNHDFGRMSKEIYTYKRNSYDFFGDLLNYIRSSVAESQRGFFYLDILDHYKDYEMIFIYSELYASERKKYLTGNKWQRKKQ